ncbi:hypothetical protein PC119_g23868 [Phytophthora cactorum]|uniref:Uncharacterized protein n=1 Tax=Phytophthora cactorum TaxID=29920 RepID=A0A8T1B250_9STRA|nr:hypothetical protein PC111_g21526 [Phytophthora cactorum]KAG2797116.1 hypothetical protein PC112_g21920 [Phytophthora cactorum]KAG2891627.1 hypothetical protein PC117_g24201 [Phytophthora cactorum]KAG2969607.1 hypothetical protein PC119_g23868 [Phytophthora cactorum]KAG3053550.1 hypothetical protein PC122_g22303 [Phytophthora cactorum]
MPYFCGPPEEETLHEPSHVSQPGASKTSQVKKAPVSSKKAAPPSKKSTTPAKRSANSSAKPPARKKKMKKKLTEEVNVRRRELAVFDKDWGHQNTTQTMGKQLTHRGIHYPVLRTDRKLMLTMYLSLKLTLTVSVYLATQTLTWSGIRMLTWAAKGVRRMTTQISRRVSLNDSGDKTYESEPEEESEDNEGKMLRFDYVDALDPNIASTHGGTELDTDGKGDDDSAEPNEDNDWDSDTDQLCDVILMLTESSEVYTNEQLGRMKQDGWDVLLDNVEAEVVDDPTVDKMYYWYCGPLKDIMAASESPLMLFYYFLPKTL